MRTVNDDYNTSHTNHLFTLLPVVGGGVLAEQTLVRIEPSAGGFRLAHESQFYVGPILPNWRDSAALVAYTHYDDSVGIGTPHISSI